MKRFKGTKGTVILIMMVMLVLGYYFYLSNRQPAAEEEETQITAVQDVLLKNLEKNYPPSPKEVVRYYSLITQCFYNEELSEEELSQLAHKAQELYDEELAGNKTDEQYMEDLKADIAKFAEDEMQISSFATSSSTDVEYFSQDGYECARIYCVYSIRQRTSMFSTNEVFILRKDDAGHWKIYGWDIADEQ